MSYSGTSSPILLILLILILKLLTMAPVDGRNIRIDIMFSVILAVLFDIKILAYSQIYRLPIFFKLLYCLTRLFVCLFVC